MKPQISPIKTGVVVWAICMMMVMANAYSAAIAYRCARLEWLNDGNMVIKNCSRAYNELYWNGTCRRYTTGDDTSTCFICIDAPLKNQRCSVVQHTPHVVLAVEMTDTGCDPYTGACLPFEGSTRPGTHPCWNMDPDSTPCSHGDLE